MPSLACCLLGSSRAAASALPDEAIDTRGICKVRDWSGAKIQAPYQRNSDRRIRII
jgi:hypothetical protein